MRICSLIFFIINEILLVKGQHNEHYTSPQLKHFGTPLIDNSYKQLYADLGTPIRLLQENMTKEKRFKRSSLGGNLYYDHKGKPRIRKKSRIRVNTTKENTQKNWFWNLFS
ncbi:uncharacterized protein LOC121467561 [Drosophila elegans]|uniref:uncharacterized protein LOC121467561 n=1 Tax=Drosophila elegans TaxID=30023 RepID=UPI001BC83C9B|nr:uncharacterized protein LOC121467561 [Drosophila elegans]